MKRRILIKPIFASFLFGSMLLGFMLLTSCEKEEQHVEVERAFYYWKNQERMSMGEQATITELGANKLYLKYFEVNNSPERGNFPEVKLDYFFASELKQGAVTVVPVVFIRNEVFLKSSKQDLDVLADNVVYLLGKFHSKVTYDFSLTNEYQIDCDWTINSKENYFYFLEKLKAVSGKTISCTLRLYPYKYRTEMGIPPVDKATLMCYNLIHPLENKDKNSILDIDELESYLNVDKPYPLHLDVALPVYGWLQIFHNERFAGIIYADKSKIDTILTKEKPMWYTVEKDMTINNTFLRVGDKVKYEEVTDEMIHQAIDVLKSNIDFKDRTTVALFHLDEEQLNNYTNAQLHSVYTDFSGE